MSMETLRFLAAPIASVILLAACGGGSATSGSSSPPPQIPESSASAVDRALASGVLPVWNTSPGVGPDTNSNGVRDDIDAYILKTWGADLLKTNAATQAASAIQRAVASGIALNAAGTSPPASSQATAQLEAVSKSLDDAVVCLTAQFSGGGAGDVLTQLESATTNTKERFQAYRAYNSHRSGSSRASANTDPNLKCK